LLQRLLTEFGDLAQARKAAKELPPLVEKALDLDPTASLIEELAPMTAHDRRPDDRELANVKLAAAAPDRLKNVRRFIEADILAMSVLLGLLPARSSVELLFRKAFDDTRREGEAYSGIPHGLMTARHEWAPGRLLPWWS
jgi:hypothetical protein